MPLLPTNSSQSQAVALRTEDHAEAQEDLSEAAKTPVMRCFLVNARKRCASFGERRSHFDSELARPLSRARRRDTLHGRRLIARAAPEPYSGRGDSGASCNHSGSRASVPAPTSVQT